MFIFTMLRFQGLLTFFKCSTAAAAPPAAVEHDCRVPTQWGQTEKIHRAESLTADQDEEVESDPDFPLLGVIKAG